MSHCPPQIDERLHRTSTPQLLGGIWVHNTSTSESCSTLRSNSSTGISFGVRYGEGKPPPTNPESNSSDLDYLPIKNPLLTTQIRRSERWNINIAEREQRRIRERGEQLLILPIDDRNKALHTS